MTVTRHNPEILNDNSVHYNATLFETTDRLITRNDRKLANIKLEIIALFLIKLQIITHIASLLIERIFKIFENCYCYKIIWMP